MTTKFVLALPLILLASSLPAHALTKQEILEQEQQQFLNPQPPTEQGSLDTEQDRFLKAKLPIEVELQPQSEPATVARWYPQTAVQTEGKPRPEIVPAAVVPDAQPMLNAAPAQIEQNIAAVRSVKTPIKKLPSLTSPEGYSRISPDSSIRPVETAAASPSVVMTTSIKPPQMALVPSPSLNGVLQRLQMSDQQMLYPLAKVVPITSIFGWRTHPIYGSARFHAGVDLGAPLGSPVLAAFSGQVVSAGWLGGYGQAIVLEHGQVRLLYAHLSQPLVIPGQFIAQGAVIGLSGSTGNSTGPHLHFEIRRLSGGEWTAIDPGVSLKVAQSQLVSVQVQLEQQEQVVRMRSPLN